MSGPSAAAASSADSFPDGAEKLLKDKYSFPDPKSIFKHVGNGVFQVKDGKTFQFYHAFKTTGDRAKNRFHDGSALPAGELWKKYSGQSVTDSSCSASNCTSSKKCTPSSPQKASATAHVYHAEQPNTEASIPYCMFIPTCSGCNNSGQTKREGTCWGYGGTRLSAYSGSKVMFVELSDTTTQGKGGGKGGSGK